MHYVTNPSGEDSWYGFYRGPGYPDNHRGWDEVGSVTTFTKVNGAYRGNIQEIMSEFNPAPRHLDSLLLRSLCCVLALGYFGERDFLNEILVSLEI